MKLTLQIQLLPTPEQAAILLATMERFNAAATFAGKIGVDAKAYHRFSLHHLVYHKIRAVYGLRGQMTARVVGIVAACIQRNKNTPPTFKPRSAIPYHPEDARRRTDDTISIASIAGRLVMPYLCGNDRRERLAAVHGESDLAYRNGKFYLICPYDVQAEQQIAHVDVLGIDLGIVKLATDSTGEVFSGEGVEKVRANLTRRRGGLSSVGTKSARRRLRKISRKEANYRRNENHRISKRIVAKAKGTGCAIALENLKGIRNRTTVRKKQRNRIGGWGFFQLRTFITYKAKLAGVPVILVDPRNTSRTCAVCGHCEKENRKSQAEFECRSCGHVDNADLNAARNVRAKAVTKRPMVGRDEAKAGQTELRLSVPASHP